jgi:aminomethyltransferase
MHVKYGGKIVDFHGWELPVEFSTIIEEHNCVRERVGLFDVSHMGEVMVEGDSAMDFVQSLITNNAQRLVDGQICYTPMCYANGTIVDDCLVYRYNPKKFFIVINASNVDKDFQWMKEHGASFENLSLVNLSDTFGQLALQGPFAEKLLQPLTDCDLSEITYYHFRAEVMVAGIKTLVSRTGYTGEDGFEIYIPEITQEKAEILWDAIMNAGADSGIQPIGLGARDTLRLESRLMLYGNDIDDTTTPIEAGLSWTVKFKKPEFNGMAVLREQKSAGTPRRLVGFEMVKKSVPRQGYDVVNSEGTVIGRVTSGSFAPYLKKYIGLAYVDSQYVEIGTSIGISIRGRNYEAVVVETPFYKRQA